MINYIQTNHTVEHVVTDQVWGELCLNADAPDILERVVEVEETYSLGILKLVKVFANYVIRRGEANHDFLKAVEFMFHHPCPDEAHARKYFIYRILKKLNLNKSELK